MKTLQTIDSAQPNKSMLTASSGPSPLACLPLLASLCPFECILSVIYFYSCKVHVLQGDRSGVDACSGVDVFRVLVFNTSISISNETLTIFLVKGKF